MNAVSWKRLDRQAVWQGSLVGREDFESREKFFVSKVKPASAPSSYLRLRRGRGTWGFEYTLNARYDLVVYNVGVFPSLEEAKAKAEAIA